MILSNDNVTINLCKYISAYLIKSLLFLELVDDDNKVSMLFLLFPLVPVCPHAGGVGLCELVQHLAAWDFISVSGSLNKRCENIPF